MSRPQPFRTGLIVAALMIIATACGSSIQTTEPAAGASLQTFRLHFEDGSLPPEFHTSSVFLFEDETLTLIRYREYEEVVESEEVVELTQQQIEELARVVRETEATEVDRVTEQCDGGGRVGITIEWSDGTAIQGVQDPSTFSSGPGGACEDYSVRGNFTAARDLLWELVES